MKFRELPIGNGSKFRLRSNNLYIYEKINQEEAMIVSIPFEGDERLKGVREVLSPQYTIDRISPDAEVIRVAAA